MGSRASQTIPSRQVGIVGTGDERGRINTRDMPGSIESALVGRFCALDALITAHGTKVPTLRLEAFPLHALRRSGLEG